MKKVICLLTFIALATTASWARIAACGEGNTTVHNVTSGQSAVCCDLGEGLLSCTDGERWFHGREIYFFQYDYRARYFPGPFLWSSPCFYFCFF